MSFGDTAFSGSRFIFWCLAPVLLIAGIGLPLTVVQRTPLSMVFSVVWPIACFAAILALYDARRFRWAARTLTGIIFLAYVGYLVDEWLLADHPIRISLGPVGEDSPVHSVVGAIVVGIPSLWYTLLGRFRLVQDADDDDDSVPLDAE